MKQLLSEAKRMQKLAGIISESVKVGDETSDGRVVIATDEENEMAITQAVIDALESKGASESDFAILVPKDPNGEYNFDLSGNQFLEDIKSPNNELTVKKRTEL